ncbi:DNA mismatch repair (MLH1) [Theileria annulata]|uniref:DNA mismatch repair (MLH1 homologue), putative n=1 Tax=Theileria annulata TaxID=5874 RepID=Q4UHU3_THEAN|nr:DNA mismatch repair (MLH1) [Theileria annulata]CAI73346.1 DNA mismatch repair (MLH1 homologue), putative [Theileria annulata]|eukprot:XP_954023.1 DNA mismatch repair (MLH1 homologue), putative [Theileria annulata]
MEIPSYTSNKSIKISMCGNKISVIRPLPAEVVKKIAAGEIIARPSSAIKELIENSVDAGATEIRVNLSSNPLDFCEIIDNGSGVSEKDLMIICQRYTTSKTTDSIEGVRSLGFRGEALSSLSQNSHVTISSRTENENMRTVMTYSECEPVLDEIRYEEGPRGFHLKYENLFYNYEIRSKSLLSNINSEFISCLHLVQKYSIHFPNINFVFNRTSSPILDLNNLNNVSSQQSSGSGSGDSCSSQPNCNFSTSSRFDDYDSSDDELDITLTQKLEYDYHYFTKMYDDPKSDDLRTEYIRNVEKVSFDCLRVIKENIKRIYGLKVSNVLQEVVFNNFDDLFFNCKGLISHPNQPCKLDMFILFVNNRLIDLPNLRRMIFNTYNDITNNRYRRFVYLSIFVPYDQIDSNIHPTKKRIMIENQAEIVEQITKFFHDKITELIKSATTSTSSETSIKIIQDYKSSSEYVNKFKERGVKRQPDISYFNSQIYETSVGTDFIGIVDYHSSGSDSECVREVPEVINSPDREKFFLPYYTTTTAAGSPVSTQLETETNNRLSNDLYNSQDTTDMLDIVPVSNPIHSTHLSHTFRPTQLCHTLNSTGVKFKSQEFETENDCGLDFDDEAEENEFLNDPNLIESFDYNRLRVEKMQKISNLSYNQIDDARKLGRFYTMKEVQTLQKPIYCFRMVDEIIQNKDEDLTKVVLSSNYIGVIDKSYVLVEYDGGLYMMNVLTVSKECCYQSIIWRLGNIPTYELIMPVSLVRLLSHAIHKYYSEYEVSDLVNPRTIKILNVLFGFQIKNMMVYKIPDLLNGYFSGEEYLPDLMYSIFIIKQPSLKDLVTQIAKAISFYYVQPPLDLLEDDIDWNYQQFMHRILYSTCQKFLDLSIPQRYFRPLMIFSGSITTAPLLSYLA